MCSFYGDLGEYKGTLKMLLRVICVELREIPLLSKLKRDKLSLSVRPVHFQLIPHILPCIKLYSKMAARVLVYGCAQF